MRRFEAIGVIEAQYYSVAVEILDHMCKSTRVEFLTSENYLGGRLVTLVVGGSVSDITEAIEVAKRICQYKSDNPLKMALMILNPHPEILKYIITSKKEKSVIEEPVVEESVIEKPEIVESEIDTTVEDNLNKTETKEDLS